MAMSVGNSHGLPRSDRMVFRNDSGSEIPAFGVMNLTGIEQDDSKQWVLIANQPDSAANFLFAVNGPIQVAAGKKGDCQPVQPVFFMAYDTGDGTPETEDCWGVDNATSKLKKHFGNEFYVIGADEENEIVLVMALGAVIRLGKTDGSIAAGAKTGTVDIWAGALDEETNTGDSVTDVLNRGSDEIATGKFVNVMRRAGGWEAYPLECS